MSSLETQILVPTDFRPAARAGLQMALQLALKSHAQITLLHVCDGRTELEPREGLDAIAMLRDVVQLPASQPTCTPAYAPRDDRASIAALKRLEQEIHPEWRQIVKVRTELRKGNPLNEILRYVEEIDVETLVLGVSLRRWRWPWSPRLTEQLLSRARCQVLLVRNSPDLVPSKQSLWARSSAWKKLALGG